MARRPPTSPRKNAAQARSRATVDALVAATARILVAEGFDKASTNRIAKVAGVSIGSLYQYFPSKEALVAAVIARHRQDILEAVRGEFAQVLAEPLDVGLRRLVGAAVKAHQVDPKLHRVLAEQIPRVGELETLETFSRENYALFRRYLEGRREALKVDDLALAAFICVTAIEALTHNAVLHPGEMQSKDRLDALIEEGTRLVTGYLMA